VECPGYRDLNRLAIYNETRDVIRKTEAAATRPSFERPGKADRCVSLVTSTSPGHLGREYTSSPALEVVPSGPSTLINDVAISHFVLACAPTGQFSYVPDLISADVFNSAASIQATVRERVSSPLSHSILACSLAILSSTPGYTTRTIRPLAYKTYNTAIESLNSALSTPTTAVLDSTLLSVLLLGLFEAVVFRGRKKPTSWAAHTQGALALLRLRGLEQFKTEIGRKMFLHAANNIRANCAQTWLTIPEELKQLQERAAAEMLLDQRKDYGARLGMVFEKLGALGVGVVKSGGFSSNRSRGIVMKALELDDEITEMVRDTTRGRRARAVDFSTLVHNGSRSQKVQPRLGRALIVLHSLRLAVSMFAYWPLIKSPPCNCRKGDNPIDAGGVDHARCLTEIQEKTVLHLISSHANDAATEILSQVPSFTDSPSQMYHFQRYLIWPLSMVAVSRLVSPSARALALGHLRELGRLSGLGQAEQAARMVEDAGTMEDWYASPAFVCSPHPVYRVPGPVLIHLSIRLPIHILS
jgi:hypothetical protein